MIRIEIEVCELDTGKIVTVCKAIQGCQKEPTSGEDRVAGELFDMLRRECPAVGKRLGTCEEIKGRERGFMEVMDDETVPGASVGVSADAQNGGEA